MPWFLDAPAQVQLRGKGRKERICPLWPETASLIAALLRRKPRDKDEPIFANRYGLPLCASGVRFRLRQYIALVAKQRLRLQDKHITPHTFRHTAAVHRVAAGVPTPRALVPALDGRSPLHNQGWVCAQPAEEEGAG